MEKVGKIIFEDLYNKQDALMIKNFIVSDNDNIRVRPTFDYPYIFNGIAFAIARRGTALVKINLVKYDIQPNTIITVLPNHVIEFLHKSDDQLTEFLLFSFDFISDMKLPPYINILEKLEFNPCLKITPEETEHIADYHAFITKQYQRGDSKYRVNKIRALLYALIIEISDIYEIKNIDAEQKNTPRNTELFNNFIKLVIRHHRQERSVEFYADKMCVTPKYLSKISKDLTGKTVSQWISDAVISTSKALLKSTQMTVLQISEEMNFANPSFFAKYFKKHAGVSPREFQSMP